MDTTTTTVPPLLTRQRWRIFAFEDHKSHQRAKSPRQGIYLSNIHIKALQSTEGLYGTWWSEMEMWINRSHHPQESPRGIVGWKMWKRIKWTANKGSCAFLPNFTWISRSMDELKCCSFYLIVLLLLPSPTIHPSIHPTTAPSISFSIIIISVWQLMWNKIIVHVLCFLSGGGGGGFSTPQCSPHHRGHWMGWRDGASSIKAENEELSTETYSEHVHWIQKINSVDGRGGRINPYLFHAGTSRSLLYFVVSPTPCQSNHHSIPASTKRAKDGFFS